ncbi:hypothetical protein Syun_004670 [Stephania yunnanensis]|uniref:Bowman-Birk serine protease inhibitors family domain-containing protein n=1 Tax=Stephania yunnanensis TaxID=152371 RepID=A0AAP0L3I7_9MAGN
MAALKLVMLGVALVALLGGSPPAVEARANNIPSILTTSESLENIDPDTLFTTGSLDEKARTSIIDSLGLNDEGNAIDCGGVACCDRHLCTFSCPPQCVCLDKRDHCHAACKNCRCTKSIPPQCQCQDVTKYTYAKCHP